MVAENEYDWNLADVWEAVAGVLPDAPAQIHGARAFTWSQFEQRANGLASSLLDGGASRNDRLAIFLRNSPEYLEASHAALKIGIPAVNTNYRYGSDELRYLWDDADVTTVVFHGSFTDQVAAVRDKTPKIRTWIHVDDGTEACPAWAVPYEQTLVATSDVVRSSWGRHGSDLFLLYTGGTTGLPKGVMWRSLDFLEQTNAVSKINYSLERGPAGIADVLAAPGRVHVSASPYMHGTGLFGAFITMHEGGTCISLTSPGFDAIELLDVIDRYRVSALSMTGEVFARRILDALDAEPGRWDVSSMREVLNSGAMLSEASKRDLLDNWPEVTLLDGFSSSESFGLGWSVATKGNIPATGRFTPGATVSVLDDEGKPVRPGSDAPGRLAIAGRVPLGYYKDTAKSEGTFVDIDGVLYALPGDRATVNLDGTIQLVGRDSLCINSGGEKIFTEEVESVILDHELVTDVLVVGLPDPVWGQLVTAVVSTRAGSTLTQDEVVAHVKTRLAGFKAPKHLVLVPTVPRAPNGKPDYDAARALVQASRAAVAGMAGQ
ncbi:acyl-CoA synthetase (AMP-forming)/AMP-acid ligase II [Jatrophihabitans sp. GAS493]|uniref:AMP-binding protein n=1 Tax=Jatrophihabitans sp. GAS493 TaxID=1907575 RepID=UPI000BC0B014|nr:AMP-binding protein [Jatrophihabitans sp. GAS493]SOD72122.1 acyl-CoA synthetase (AMP-forming)/AMP-acid ligase II [Jatrophihabitans sp. GAS493]